MLGNLEVKVLYTTWQKIAAYSGFCWVGQHHSEGSNAHPEAIGISMTFKS